MITIEVRINPNGAGIDCLLILNISPSVLPPYFQRVPSFPPLVSFTKKGPKYDWLKNYDFTEIVWDRRRFFLGLAEALMGSTSITLVIKIYELCDILPDELSFFLLVLMTLLLC